MRASEIIVRMLHAYQVGHVFGVPGDTSMSFYDAMAESNQIRHILCRDERSAGYMADAYARVSQRPAVVEAPSGGGATYLLPATAESDGSSVPTVALTSDVPQSSQLRGTITALDQVDTFRAHTRLSHKLERVDMIPHAVRCAFRAATGGRMGAAHLSFSEDILSGSCPVDDIYADSSCIRYPAWRCRPDPAAVQQTVNLVAEAERPLILAGGGVLLSDAHSQLVELAETIQVPVVTSMDGKGAIPEDHPLALGVVGSNGGKKASNSALSECDVLLALGTKLNSTTTNGGELLAHNPTLIHIDIDPQRLGCNARAEVSAIGDARAALSDLLEAGGSLAINPETKKWITDKKKSVEEELFSIGSLSGKGELHPAQMVTVMRRLLPPESVIICDAGTPTPWIMAHYPVRQPGKRVFAARSHGSLGYAMPAALGAHMALDGTPVVAVMGDGSLGMSIGELETLVREGSDITVIHLNNGTYGWIKMLQKLYYDERYFSVDFERGPDYAQAAASLGAETHAVSSCDQMEEALQRSTHSGAVSFIEVDVPAEVEAVPPVAPWERDISLSPDERSRRSY